MLSVILSIIDEVLKMANRVLVKFGKKPIKREKPTIYVVLPTNKEGRTMGDGLLQAAGFLAAKSLFGDEIEIQPYDHHNKESKAKNLLYKIIDLEKKKKGPICIIFTMSDICRAIAQEFKDKIQKQKKIAKRLNIIFTVASIDDKSLRDGKNLLHHFVTCDKETERIALHRDSIISEIKNKTSHPMSRAALLYLTSGYPRETASLLKKEFGATVTLDEVQFDREGRTKDSHKVADIAKIADVNKRFAIIVAYDAALKEALKTLKDVGYKGKVLCTTTLSVKDWQEYLKKKEYFVPDINLFYTYVKGFDTENKHSKFAESLHHWNFETITGQEKSKFYKGSTDDIRRDFAEYDKYADEIYENIYPNYISAFCFDSVRLFVEMHSLNAKSLYNKKMKENNKEHIKKYSPFEKIVMFEHDGKTEVTLGIGEI